jgi:hypothetical protein
MFSDEAKGFIGFAIKSVWALELLLFLRKNTQARPMWSIEALTRELRASPLIVREAVGAFRTAGLIAEDEKGDVRYAPASPYLENLVTDIAAEYAKRPLTVAREIYAADAAQIKNFADAFRFRKD